MSEVKVPESKNPETIEEPTEDPIEEAEEDTDILAAADKREEKIRSIVAHYRAKHPDAVLYLIDIKGDDRIFIAKLGSFKKMAKYAELMRDEKGDISEPMINMVQKHLVHPKLSYEQLADGPDVAGYVKAGHVATLVRMMQEANGFEDEAELKKL